MDDCTNVVIGIQARSTSQRYPKKVFEVIESKSILQHVIDNCKSAAKYINRFQNREVVQVALLIPKSDVILEVFRNRAVMVEGSETNVLSRYSQMASWLNADYIVRITADCPLIPHFLITKHIKAAVMNGYDYFSNVHEGVRTSPDGYDCEVFSRKLLEYTVQHAKDPKDLEHVTTFMRREPPEWIKWGTVIGHMDLSHLKLSVDDQEDLNRVRTGVKNVQEKLEAAERIFGKQNVHRF